MRLLALVLSTAIPCLSALAEEESVGGHATALAFIEPDGTQVVEIDASIDNVLFDEYWDRAYAALFAFADVDHSGALDDKEIRLVPSARAVRLALGNGFTPPVASIDSAKDVVEDASQACTPEALKRYYRRNRASGVHVGFGELRQAPALAAALIQALDQNKDATLSRAELLSAENSLRTLDTNDDELIGAGEILPNCVYPGCAATNEVYESIAVDMSNRPDSKSLLVWLPVEMKDREALLRQWPEAKQSIVSWKISISDQISDAPLCWDPKSRAQSRLSRSERRRRYARAMRRLDRHGAVAGTLSASARSRYGNSAAARSFAWQWSC